MSRTPPRIIVCDVYPTLYGAQRSMLQLYERWHREGRFRVHVAYFFDGPLSAAVVQRGIPATRLPVGPLLGSFNKKLLRLRWWEYPALLNDFLHVNRAVKGLLLEQGADLFHCNTDRAGLMCFLGARRARCPMVTHMRRDTSFGWRDKVIYRHSSELIWVSRRIRDEFAQTHALRNPRGRIIYNGRDLPDRNDPSSAQEIRQEFALPGDARIALVAAGFDERKDHETLIAAAAVACRNEPRLYFLLAGDDQTTDQARITKIKQLAGVHGLQQHVQFLGHRTDVGRLMRGADILVNPAREEALGGALIEAMGYGLPCVATDVGGTAEIAPDGLCGLLVPPGEPDLMAARILELVGDAELRRKFAAQARQQFDRNFTIERCAEQTAAFFDEMIRHASKMHRSLPA